MEIKADGVARKAMKKMGKLSPETEKDFKDYFEHYRESIQKNTEGHYRKDD